MAQSARRRLSREERRAQLIEVGRGQVERSSFDALSTDEVAEEAGISRGLLFHYFPTREDFLVALAEDAAGELLELTDPDPDLPPLERLRQGLAAYVDYVTANRDLYLALIRGASGGSAGMQAVFEETREIQAHRILDGLGMDGDDVPATMWVTARGYVAYVEEVTVTWLRGDRGLGRGELLQLLEESGAALVAAAGIPLESLVEGA